MVPSRLPDQEDRMARQHKGSATIRPNMEHLRPRRSDVRPRSRTRISAYRDPQSRRQPASRTEPDDQGRRSSDGAVPEGVSHAMARLDTRVFPAFPSIRDKTYRDK
ncbi:hypothetical protein NPX13_g4719 [Xylaria arbuscula]|uniref:Uncharacterized protein n=1 Tax=Xylaria arbuscula TaxID=114810 RepID=A0A9W8NFT7_9PEZI|nr:hypothetical protein NPX13_g4719 [Xylaria arbuscula]